MATKPKETFTSIKAKMNNNVSVAVDAMNVALQDIIANEDISAKVKLKVSQDYLGLYLKLINEEMKESEHREIMRQRKLNTLIKQDEVRNLQEDKEGAGQETVNQAKFSPTMIVS